MHGSLAPLFRLCPSRSQPLNPPPTSCRRSWGLRGSLASGLPVAPALMTQAQAFAPRLPASWERPC